METYQKKIDEQKADFQKRLREEMIKERNREIEAIINAARFTAFAASRPVQTFDLVNEISRTVPVSRSMRVQVDHMMAWAGEYARRTNYDEQPEYNDDNRIIRA